MQKNLNNSVKKYFAESNGLKTGNDWVAYYTEYGALCPKKLLQRAMGNREFYCYEHAARYPNGDVPDEFWQFTEQLPKPTTQKTKPYPDGSGYDVVQTWVSDGQTYLALWHTNRQGDGETNATYFVAKEYVEQ
tara:strand:- start:862 stop:1260 length:399 start_codon:yes stop_codon:yes gene_type:complete